MENNVQLSFCAFLCYTATEGKRWQSWRAWTKRRSGSVRTAGTSVRSTGGNTDADTCLGYCQRRRRIPASAGRIRMGKIDLGAGYQLRSFTSNRASTSSNTSSGTSEKVSHSIKGNSARCPRIVPFVGFVPPITSIRLPLWNSIVTGFRKCSHETSSGTSYRQTRRWAQVSQRHIYFFTSLFQS